MSAQHGLRRLYLTRHAGSASSSSSSTPVARSATPTPSASLSSIPTPSLPSVSSAPKVDDFAPPEPTRQDPYPGYYLLPSGQWAAHDPAYYKKFYDKWKKEYDAHVRALEKGVEKGFEGVESEGAAEVNAFEEMEKAKREIQEREEKKALTAGGQHVQVAPRMNIKGAALGGRARTRHQLSSLLTEAYSNREALEERIAQGRKNRKEAGNKYGASSYTPFYTASLTPTRLLISGSVHLTSPSKSSCCLRSVHEIVRLYAGDYICMYTCTINQTHSIASAAMQRG